MGEKKNQAFTKEEAESIKELHVRTKKIKVVGGENKSVKIMQTI